MTPMIAPLSRTATIAWIQQGRGPDRGRRPESTVLASTSSRCRTRRVPSPAPPLIAMKGRTTPEQILKKGQQQEGPQCHGCGEGSPHRSGGCGARKSAPPSLTCRDAGCLTDVGSTRYLPNRRVFKHNCIRWRWYAPRMDAHDQHCCSARGHHLQAQDVMQADATGTTTTTYATAAGREEVVCSSPPGDRRGTEVDLSEPDPEQTKAACGTVRMPAWPRTKTGPARTWFAFSSWEWNPRDRCHGACWDVRRGGSSCATCVVDIMH